MSYFFNTLRNILIKMSVASSLNYINIQLFKYNFHICKRQIILVCFTLLSFILKLTSHLFMPVLPFHFSPASHTPFSVPSFHSSICDNPHVPHKLVVCLCCTLPTPTHHKSFFCLPVCIFSFYALSHTSLSFFTLFSSLALRNTYIIFLHCGWYQILVLQL